MAQRIPVTCPCGKRFEVIASRLAAGRGKYCSQACKYWYRTRPSGLTYNIVRDNPTWFKPGQEAWNKDLKGSHVSPATEFKPGPEHPFWQGGPEARHSNSPGYHALHVRLRRVRGRAADHVCAYADATCSGQMQWASISRKYRELEDFMVLCQSHHVRYDFGLLG